MAVLDCDRSCACDFGVLEILRTRTSKGGSILTGLECASSELAGLI